MSSQDSHHNSPSSQLILALLLDHVLLLLSNAAPGLTPPSHPANVLDGAANEGCAYAQVRRNPTTGAASARRALQEWRVRKRRCVGARVAGYYQDSTMPFTSPIARHYRSQCETPDSQSSCCIVLFQLQPFCAFRPVFHMKWLCLDRSFDALVVSESRKNKQVQAMPLKKCVGQKQHKLFVRLRQVTMVQNN